ncbi:outer membrane beta-barrel protein [Chryseobacterium sp.]|uniref:outer membrane beta-barrel protein n=1 Tax=Chryseobacterium sp. TaxID=1871047 RepID=UPI0011CACF8E|nr:outer membrane beta-barrel protein [Chryseobacterium sp.]TXF76148.1 outer membrane beta-barrel protein [Chryseobacterium sp.]
MKRALSVISIFAFLHSNAQQKPTPDKETKIEAVTITKVKKAVEQKADRTIFDFSEQPNLNSGSVMEGIKKLPGLIVSDVAGMLYQGKMLDVYLDGRPLNISSNELNAFLEGMPANSVERVEVITQPGAEFPATSGGAIINIITSKTAKNYLTATYSGNYNFTKYDKWRHRTNNSVSLNARNKLFGWQLNFGQNYRESMLNATQDDLAESNADRIIRGYFAKSAFTFELGQDRLLLNYDIYHNNNDITTFSSGTFLNNSYQSTDLTSTLSNRHEAVATYQKRFADKSQKLDFKFSYSNSNSGFTQNNLDANRTVLDNSSDMDVYNFKVDYSQPLNILNEGKVAFGGMFDRQNFDTKAQDITNLDYQRQNVATYLEFQTKYKKFDFILGTRAEDYDISGITYNQQENRYEELTPFKKFKFFPNASMQYNLVPQVYFSLNYNKKITLPSISVLNPNNNTYQNPNSSITGNPEVRPTIFDNYEAKISAFDYAFVGYNVSVAKDQVVQKITRSGDVISTSQVNVSEMKIHNFNIGLPIPYMIFNTSIKEMLKFDFNPDKINYLYVYAGYQIHQLPDIETNGFWIFSLNSQIILPKEIKFVANFNYLTPKASYFYLVADKPFNNSLNLNFSKKFMKDKLTVSLYADDILNSQKMAVHSVVQQPFVYLSSKNDSRRFGISINYKIPTKNNLAKEDPNLLNKDKKEESAGEITPP